MLHHHLSDEVVFSVFDHTEAHNVKEGIAIGIWHQRVCVCIANQFLKAVTVELLRGSMDRRFAHGVADKRARISILQQGINHEWIAS